MKQNQKMNLKKNAAAGSDAAMEYPQGLKWTKQRKSIYKILFEATEPLNAIQIYGLAARDANGEEYAVSTIYRILAVFEEKGLAEKSVGMGDGAAVYTLNRGGHTHYAICLECHKRVPLQGCPFARMHPTPASEDFAIIGHKLELYGYCGECRRKQL